MCATTDVRRGHSSIFRVFSYTSLPYAERVPMYVSILYIYIYKFINTHFFFFTDFPLNACFHCFQHIQHGAHTRAYIYIYIILLYSLAGTMLIDYPHASLNGGEKAKKNSTGYGYIVGPTAYYIAMAIVRYCRRRRCESEKWRVNALRVYILHHINCSAAPDVQPTGSPK